MIAFLLLQTAYQGPFPAPLSNPADFQYRAGSSFVHPGAQGRSAAADLDGDSMLDFVALRDSDNDDVPDTVDVALAPALFASWLRDVWTANALDVYPSVTAERDGLVVVGPAGAELVELTSGWSSTSLWGGPWVDATQVAVRQVTGEAYPRIYGVMANGRTIRMLEHDGSSWTDNFVASPTEDVLDIGPLEWDGAGADDDVFELAVLTATRLLVYDRETIFLPVPQDQWISVHQTDPPGFTPKLMTVGGQSGYNKEWVAWTSSFDSAPEREVIVSTSDDGESIPRWLFGDPGSAALSTGDWAGPPTNPGTVDGKDDVGISTLLGYETVNYNDGAVPPEFRYTGSSMSVVGDTADTESNLVFADFDNDDQLDLAFAVPADGSVYVDRGGPQDQHPQDNIIQVDNIFQVCSDGPDAGKLALDLEWPSGAPPNAHAVEIAVFEQEFNSLTTNPNSIWQEVYLPATIASGYVVTPFEPPTNSVYYFVVQLVQLQTPGDPNSAVRSMMWSQVYGIEMQTAVREAPDEVCVSTNCINILEPNANGDVFWIGLAGPGDCTGPLVGTGVPMATIANMPEGFQPVIQR